MQSLGILLTNSICFLDVFLVRFVLLLLLVHWGILSRVFIASFVRLTPNWHRHANIVPGSWTDRPQRTPMPRSPLGLLEPRCKILMQRRNGL